MSTQFYADIPTAIKHSRHTAKAPLTWDPVAHVTSRFGFGPTPGLRAAVAKQGVRWWFSRQTWLGTHHAGYTRARQGRRRRPAAGALALRRCGSG